MKQRVLFGMTGIALLGLSMSSCLGMMESTLDVPLGYGSNVGVTVSNYIPPLVNNWGYGGWNGLGWFPGSGPGIAPIVPPVRPALRPGTVTPLPPANNWRPPVNNTWRPPVISKPSTPAPAQAPNRPGTSNSNINYRPVDKLPTSSQGRH
ncbi:MAG: hypothetical protein K2H84_02510 [Paramuribaculum sp.]|nr:hypothetical protein [Paramuribaculum sp.]